MNTSVSFHVSYIQTYLFLPFAQPFAEWRVFEQ